MPATLDPLNGTTEKTVHNAAGYTWRTKPAVGSRVTVVLLRMLAVLFAAQFSGVVHTALDVAAALGVTQHPDDGCDGDGGAEDHECPPGCPSCHCSHGALAWSPPRAELGHVVVYPPLQAAGFVPYERTPPRGAEVTPPDRPPRLALVL